jgi:hypothetical protein
VAEGDADGLNLCPHWRQARRTLLTAMRQVQNIAPVLNEAEAAVAEGVESLLRHP